jgi:hypothetical protein
MPKRRVPCFLNRAETADRTPPPIPGTLKNTRLWRLQAEPHMKELKVKRAIEAIW